MEELGDALRSTSGSRETDELHVRRERTRLLAAFDASLVRAPSSGRTKKWLGAVAAVALVALVALRLASTRAVTPTAPAFEAVSVRAERTTKWSRRTEAQVETITLETGSLSIRIDHRSPHRRLLVLLPDGELEDIGTTFSVTADGGRTTAVTVHEGSVVLRLRDALPLTLRAGDSWAPTPTRSPTLRSFTWLPARTTWPTIS
jgi:ferric-dicitrate binding protein FerR (iron transport regulator)